MELQITMIPSPEDMPWKSDPYQSELRNLGLTLRADGLDIHDIAPRAVSAGTPHPISGDWSINLGATLEPTLKAPLGTWLQARRGRTVRLKIGAIEADIRTIEELSDVIRVAHCYQKVAESES